MLTLVLCLALAVAEQAVPVANEPRHHVVYQNDWVRVIDAYFPVGDTTLYHTHDRDNVPICLAGGSMTTQPLGGTRAAGNGARWHCRFRARQLHAPDRQCRADGFALPRRRGPAAAASDALGPETGLANHSVEIRQRPRARVPRARAGNRRLRRAHVHPHRVLDDRRVCGGLRHPSNPGRAALPPPPGSLTWYDRNNPCTLLQASTLSRSKSGRINQRFGPLTDAG